MSSSDSDGSDDNLDGAVCEQLCQEFAAITGTDSALAMYFLQNRKWDLQNALNMFYEDLEGKEGPFILAQDEKDVFQKPSDATGGESSGRFKVTALTFGGQQGEPSPLAIGASADTVDGATPLQKDTEPHRIRLLSWNIDGLDQNNIQTRTKAVIQLIKRENPDIVFLQEVVPDTLALIQQTLTDYMVIPGNTAGYFTAMLLKRSTVQCESHQAMPFYSSKMGRNLLVVEAKVKSKPFLLMTSHFESTKSHAEERLRQLKTAFKHMKDAGSERTVIFGGDLNLRDKELLSIGGTPEGIHDIWELTGKRKIAEFTWDTTKNDNLGMDGKFKPRSRFDRLYVRFDERSTVKPVYFELVGLERIPVCLRFPSDHWGILTHYDIK